MNYYDVPALSNSAMGALNPAQSGSPRKFRSGSKGADKSISLERGSLLHLAILEPEKFIVQDVDRPTGMMGAFVEAYYEAERAHYLQCGTGHTDALGIAYMQERWTEAAITLAGYKTSAATVWKNFQEPGPQAYYNYLKTTPGKIPITRETREILDGCIANISSHPLARRMLLDENADDVSSWNELEVFWVEVVVIEVEGELVEVEVKCKAKLDRLRYNATLEQFQYVDLKTSSNGLGRFGESFVKYRYYRQNAFYDRGIRHFAAARNIPFTTVTHFNVVSETTGLYECGVFKTTAEWLEKGREEYESILKRYAWHSYHNLWEHPMEYYLNNGLLSLPSI